MTGHCENYLLSYNTATVAPCCSASSLRRFQSDLAFSRCGKLRRIVHFGGRLGFITGNTKENLGSKMHEDNGFEHLPVLGTIWRNFSCHLFLCSQNATFAAFLLLQNSLLCSFMENPGSAVNSPAISKSCAVCGDCGQLV